MTDRIKSKTFIQPLPSKPDLEKQKKLSKSLVKDYCNGQEAAIERIYALHPNPPKAKDFQLSDAQLVIARGYGFASWSKLKHKIESLIKTPMDFFIEAINKGDPILTTHLLEKHPELKHKINEPKFSFGATAVIAARTNIALLDLLLDNGADLNIKSDWHMGPFGILEQVTKEQAQPLIERGAKVDVWGAAKLGMYDKLSALITQQPSNVNAKGGDGKRPLHYASSIEIAKLLLAHGAQIDAICDDHESTAAQYLVADHPEVCRYLIRQGCKTDLFMACVLNDADLARKHIWDDPNCLNMRVDDKWFPKTNPKSGGTMYQWILGFCVTPMQVARKFNASEVVEILLENSKPTQLLLDALWSGEKECAEKILKENTRMIGNMKESDFRQVTDAACNGETAVVIDMLEIGFPATIPGRLGGNVLHWAGYHGNDKIMAAALKTKPSLNDRESSFDGLPTGWVIVGCRDRNLTKSIDGYVKCLKMLLEAGAECDDFYPTGIEDIDNVLRKHFYPDL